MPIGGLGMMREPYQGGLGRRVRRRYADGGELGPDGLPIPGPENLWNGAGVPSPGQTGYDEQMAGWTLGITGGRSEDPARFALGPPYTPSQADYAGPPPMAPEIFRGGEGAPPPGALDYSAGTAAPANWEDFKGNTSTGGGFFTIRDIFEGRGDPVPEAFQRGSDAPSTNNYRLFGGDPSMIMRNGEIIDMNSPFMFGPYGGPAMGWNPPHWNSGAGGGYPVAYAPGSTAASIGGWPGQLDPWASLGTAGMWRGGYVG